MEDNRINNQIKELKVFYYLTKGVKHKKIYGERPFFILHNLEPNQTHINLSLIKYIISSERNIHKIEEYRYLNEIKKGFIKITESTSFPIINDHIILQIQLKEEEPKELKELKKAYEYLELKMNEFKNVNDKMNKAIKTERPDLILLYSFPMVERESYEGNSIIAYHLEIGKLYDIYKNAKRRFNVICEAANRFSLEESIRREPKIIHISCHGRNPKQGQYSLIFENKGDAQDITAEELETNILSKNSDHLKKIDLVFLSSCHSEIAGKLFLKYGVKNVIYINKNFPISNTASLNFTIFLYKELVDAKIGIKCAFESAKKNLYETEKKNYVGKIKCCCKAHESHNKACSLSKNGESVHNLYHTKLCKCDFEEFCFHKEGCELLKSINKNNKNNTDRPVIEKIGNNIYKVCCGCDKHIEDIHHIDESFKFIYESNKEEYSNIIIYKENMKGKLEINKNCFIVKDKEDYKDNFLLLIDRRKYVKIIYKTIDEKKKHFFIIHGDFEVGKYNFAKSVYTYLFERKVVKSFFEKQRVREIEQIKIEVESKLKEIVYENYEDDKYIFIFEIDAELETPINLVNDILNENSILDDRFYFFILFRPTKNKIENELQNSEKYELIKLENLTDEKARQLINELKVVYPYKTNYLNEGQLKELIKIYKNKSRKGIVQLLKKIARHKNYDDLMNDVILENKSREKKNNEISDIIGKEKIRKIIFLLYKMKKGLPALVLKLFEPNFESNIKLNKADKFFYSNGENIWNLNMNEFTFESFPLFKDLDKNLIEDIIEIFSKLLFHYVRKNCKNIQQNHIEALDTQYYFNYFFENVDFFKTFNKEIYEECFIKDEKYSIYENIIQNCYSLNENNNIENLRFNICNIIESNKETISKLYYENEKMREYINQILINIPRAVMKNNNNFKNVILRCENYIKKIESGIMEICEKNKVVYLFVQNNLFKLKLLIKLFFLKYEKIDNMAQFEALDDSKLGKAYAIFIKGLFKYNTSKSDFIKAQKLFENHPMSAYCYYKIGNCLNNEGLFVEAAEKYEKGRLVPKCDEFIKGILNAKLAKLIIDKFYYDEKYKKKFNEIIEELNNLKNKNFNEEGVKLKKDMEIKLLPDIVMLNSNPFVKENNYSKTNSLIDAYHNNQYYLLEKLKKSEITTNLTIKVKVLNEPNLREAFSWKGKVLIIQSDDFNEEGEIMLESDQGKSFPLSKKFFDKINKINYDIVVLCFINSGKLKEILKNKVKYLITFDDNCQDIFDDIKDEAIVKYNTLSIDFLKHFIINITKEKIDIAFKKAHFTFKQNFLNFIDSKSNIKYKVENFITSTNEEKIKKTDFFLNLKKDRINFEINRDNNKNINITPYPLVNLTKTHFSNKILHSKTYSEDIFHIISLIIDKEFYIKYKNNNIIKEINIILKNDSDMYSELKGCNAKQQITLEIMRFLFRHHDMFNPYLFFYCKDETIYSNNYKDFELQREANSSGVGLIIIDKSKKKINSKISGFIYLYLSKDLFPKITSHFIQIKIPTNDYKKFSMDDLDKNKKKGKKSKKGKKNNKKNKIKNSDSYSNNSSNNTPHFHYITSGSNISLNEQKMKLYNDEESGFTILDHVESEDDIRDDDYLSED